MASAACITSNTLPMLQDEQNGGVQSWCDLPSDLYAEILRRLPCCKDGVHLAVVCRHWRVCARQHHFPWRRQALPMRLTRTPRGTHVVHVQGFSWFQEQHLPLCQPLRRSANMVQEARPPEHQQCIGGFVDSPPFGAAGLDWAIRYYPGSDDGGGDGERGCVGVFVRLLTEGAVVKACVGLVLLDQTNDGYPHMVIWDGRWPTLFDAASAEWCTRGSRKVARRRGLKGSRYVRADCLKIEFVVRHVSRER